MAKKSVPQVSHKPNLLNYGVIGTLVTVILGLVGHVYLDKQERLENKLENISSQLKTMDKEDKEFRKNFFQFNLRKTVLKDDKKSSGNLVKKFVARKNESNQVFSSLKTVTIPHKKGEWYKVGEFVPMNYVASKLKKEGEWFEVASLTCPEGSTLVPYVNVSPVKISGGFVDDFTYPADAKKIQKDVTLKSNVEVPVPFIVCGPPLNNKKYIEVKKSDWSKWGTSLDGKTRKQM